MLLLSPVRAAAALGAVCRTVTGEDAPDLVELLRLITPRVEKALNVVSLSRETRTDTFKFSNDPKTGLRVLRLSNGFLLPGAPIVYGNISVGGSPLTEASLTDPHYGNIYLPRSAYTTDDGEYVTVQYTSGFAIPEAGPGVHPETDYRVLQGVPDDISGIVASLLVNAKRNNLQAPAAPSQYGFLPTLNQAIYKDIHARIYNYYDRPRAGVIFPTMSVRNV